MKHFGIIFISGLGLLATVSFTNCSKTNFDATLKTTSLTELSSEKNLNTESEGESFLASVKVMTSNSPNGPWVQNGDVCRELAAYFRLVGSYDPSTLRGCASPTQRSDCVDFGKYRSYLATEITNGEVMTVLTATEMGQIPAGNYSFFNYDSRSGMSARTYEVGHSQFKDCGSQRSAITCQWKEMNPQFVIGGGPVLAPPSGVCNQSTKGQKAYGIDISSSGSSTSDKLFECRCQL